MHVPSVASKHVHVRKKTRSNWVQTCHVLRTNIRSLEYAAVVDLIRFRSMKYSLQEFLDVKNNFWRQVCCFWARNMPESEEKWDMSGTRWSKTYKQRSFGATVCFNGCQTSNVWRQNTSCLAPYLDATDGIYLVYAHMWPYLYIGFNSLSPKSDQHQFSPDNIDTSSKEMVMRINKMINKGEMRWSL